MQDHYQLHTVEDVQEDEARILEILTALMDKGGGLKLLNYYKEVPVSFGASIDCIERGVVDMTVHQTQALAIREQKMSFLKSEKLPHDVIARVQRLNMNRLQVSFSQLAYVQIRSERREHVRVKVSDRIETVFYGSSQIKGVLHDISISGISLLAPEQSIAEGSAGKIRLCLAGAPLDVPATLLRVIRWDQGCRYLIKLDATEQIQNLISRFIFQLQAEIIRELKDQL